MIIRDVENHRGRRLHDVRSIESIRAPVKAAGERVVVSDLGVGVPRDYPL
jgi:hypothetical protein